MEQAILIIHFLSSSWDLYRHSKSHLVPTEAQTTFKIEATGDDLTFLWQKNASDVHSSSNHSGTDTNTLSILPVKKSDEGFYRCLMMNEIKMDGILSEEAQLSVSKFRLYTSLVDTVMKLQCMEALTWCIPF